ADGARNPEQRRAVVGRLPGSADRASLLLFAHPDGEPAADTSDWQREPFVGTLDGERFYGWGVADDLAGCASAVLALERVASAPGERGSVVFASTPSKRYARGVAAVLHRGERADAALYLHPAESGLGMGEIKALASGQLEFRITVRGRLPETTEPGQTAFSHLAINPLDKAIVLRDALYALAEARAECVRHPLIEAEVGRATNLHISAVQCGTMGNLSRLSETCKMGGAVSFPPGETFAEVQAEIEAALAKASAADPWLAEHPPELTWLTGVTGAELTTDHPLWRVASSAVERVTGRPPQVNPMHTSSDIRNPPVEAGIPCVGLGCLGGNLSQNGRHDEWVDAADFVRMVEVTAQIAEGWCRRPKDTASPN
ncbi:MAG: M20/M25/M40 family metallo-hydrolase, partial [Pseudomonadota bacterium]